MQTITLIQLLRGDTEKEWKDRKQILAAAKTELQFEKVCSIFNERHFPANVWCPYVRPSVRAGGC